MRLSLRRKKRRKVEVKVKVEKKKNTLEVLPLNLSLNLNAAILFLRISTQAAPLNINQPQVSRGTTRLLCSFHPLVFCAPLRHFFLKYVTTDYTDYTDFFRVFCVFRGPNIKMPLKAYIHRWRKPGEKNDRGF